MHCNPPESIYCMRRDCATCKGFQMTTYNVEYITGGIRKVASFGSAIDRALWIIGMAAYIEVVRQWQGSR